MRIKGYLYLIILCLFYWLLDSIWSYWSFEINLKKLIFAEPTSYLDTFLLKVSPYQLVSRLMVVVIFIVTGSIIIQFWHRRRILAEEKEKSQLVLNEAEKLAKVGGWEWDIESDVWNLTDNWLNLHGCTQNCLNTSDLLSIAYPDDIPAMQKALSSTALSGEPYSLAYRIVRLDTGEIRYIQAHGEAKVDAAGKPVKMLGASQDVTTRIQGERALKESEERYRQLFEMESDAIFLIENSTGNILEVNNAASGIYGYSRAELLGMKNTDISAEPEETELRTLNEDTIVPIRYHKRKDGYMIPVEITATHFHWKDNRVHIAAVRDISARIKAEEEKRKLEKLIQHTQKMESIGNLAGGIAHDFNNILASIIGNTELAMDDAEPGTALQNHLQEVYASALRASDLVRQILTFARQTEEEKKPTEISDVINETMKIVRPSTASNIEIKVKIDSNSLVMGNSSQLQQVLMNLCTNSVQAMQDRGGSLEIGVQDVYLSDDGSHTSSGKEEANFVELTVTDYGPGIETEIIDRIFEPYYTTKGVGQGIGMGLSIVKGIIDSHSGRISVTSKPGEKTIFTVLLPTVTSKSNHQSTLTDPVPTGTEHILFIDDEPSITEMGKNTLERLGYKVTKTTSGMKGLALFRTKPNTFDLVISDMTMPAMTGDVLSIELRKIRPSIPIILCTGYSGRLNEESSKKMGIDAFVYKPFRKTDIAKTVRNVLDTSSSQQTVN